MIRYWLMARRQKLSRMGERVSKVGSRQGASGLGCPRSRVVVDDDF